MVAKLYVIYTWSYPVPLPNLTVTLKIAYIATMAIWPVVCERVKTSFSKNYICLF